jgi:hypothetical protein
VKYNLSSTAEKSLVAFGIVANAASIFGFWMSYVSSSAEIQARFWKISGLIGAMLAAATYLLVAWWMLYRKHWTKTAENPLVEDGILIFSNGPVLFVNRKRSHAEIQMAIFSNVQLELLYIEAKIFCNNMEVTVIESNKPFTIPALNPQSQIFGKSLTEKEMERFLVQPGTFFNINGHARLRGPDGKGFTKLFGFCAAGWWLPD